MIRSHSLKPQILANGTATCDPGGDCTYTPDAGFVGTDTFDYTITDGNGGFDTATVTVTVEAENTPPVAIDDAAGTNETRPVTIDVLANDTDPETDPLTITGSTDPTNGTADCSSDIRMRLCARRRVRRRGHLHLYHVGRRVQ